MRTGFTTYGLKSNRLMYNPIKIKNGNIFYLSARNRFLHVSESDNELNFYGGDYAGHSATFNAKNGELIRVPEHLVPESMIEWGQVPGALEIITSEDLDRDPTNSAIVMERATVSIMPEVGCGVDNLDTTTKKMKFLLKDGFLTSSFKAKYTESADMNEINFGVSSFHQDVYMGSPASKVQTKRKVMMETTFSHSKKINMATNDKHDDDDEDRRVRVQLDLLMNTDENESKRFQITGPIIIQSERKASTISSQGDIAKGGGLDARTVTSLIGAEHANKPFTENKETIPKIHDLVGTWERSYPNIFDKEIIRYSESELKSKKSSICLCLPLGVIIKYIYDAASLSLRVEVSQLVDESQSHGIRKSRVVCARHIELKEDDEFQIISDHWMESVKS